MTDASKAIRLLADGALLLDVEQACRSATMEWVPRFPPGPVDDSEPTRKALIRVRTGRGNPSTAPSEKPILRLFSVSAWFDSASASVRIRGNRAGVYGQIDLERREAELIVPAGELEAGTGEIFTALTVTSALLLGRLGRTLIHSAAAVDPEGASWLLIGDTHTGKTTTTINLVRGGWGFLSDDHVVAKAGMEAPEIEGWPRPFHVDEGWQEGRIAGRRQSVEPRAFDTGRWLRKAPLAGLLFPEVNPHEPTGLRRITGAVALSLLIRQTPWLLADPDVAQDILSLLTRISLVPAFRLSVGRDSYSDSALLLRRFASRGELSEG